MHNLKSLPGPARSHDRRTLEVFVVVGGICATYKLARHVRTRVRVPTTGSEPSASLWWSGLMFLVYRALRPADRSRPDSPLVPGNETTAPTLPSGLGEHSQWLESFRTQQAYRVKSDAPNC